MSNKSKPVSLTEQILTNAKSPRVTIDKLSETVPAPDRLLTIQEQKDAMRKYDNGMVVFSTSTDGSYRALMMGQDAKTSALVRAECQEEIASLKAENQDLINALAKVAGGNAELKAENNKLFRENVELIARIGE